MSVPVKRGTLLSIVLVAICVAGLVLLAGVWMPDLLGEFSAKILASCVIIAVVAGVAYAISSDISEDKDRRKDNYLN